MICVRLASVIDLVCGRSALHGGAPLFLRITPGLSLGIDSGKPRSQEAPARGSRPSGPKSSSSVVASLRILNRKRNGSSLLRRKSLGRFSSKRLPIAPLPNDLQSARLALPYVTTRRSLSLGERH